MSLPDADPRGAILVVDDDETLVNTLAKLLRQHYPCVYTALSGAEAVEILARKRNISIVLVDVVMPLMDGLCVLDHTRQFYPDCSVILMTGYGAIETAVEAIKRGAEDYITKPFDTDTVLKKISRLMELYELKQRVAELEGQRERESAFAQIVAGSPAMQAVLARAHAAAESAAPVLLVGETGTGKEMLARAIHSAGPRAARPFIPVNCAALPRELIESELFGHRKGAFTGASSDHSGLFQAADGGTLFLDEIAEMPAAAQAKLLRVLEHGEVRPLGETAPLHVDVRLLSASNRPLAELAGGALREDLFFRVSTLVIELPPLRHRREDLPLLTHNFLEELGRRYGRQLSVERAALDLLLAYPFPGNVRELTHILESAVALSTDNPQVITERDLRPLLRTPPPGREPTPGLPGHWSLETLEKFAIRQALRLAGNNKSRAAALLGLSRGTLYRKLKQYGLESPEDEAETPASTS